MIFQNPRSPESFLSIFTPLKKIEAVKFPEEKAILNAIMRELGRFERQDIVESSLYLERAYMLNEMLNSNLRQKMNTSERELAVKLLKKTWAKISQHPINPDDHGYDRSLERSDLYTDPRWIRAKIREIRETLNHYGDMIQNNARFARSFRDSKISFALQPVEKSLELLRELEGKLEVSGDDKAYEKAIQNATETIEYLELTPDLKWFRILDSNCSFEADMMGHCASEGGHGVNLFSLREKRGKYFYPVVTTAWHPLHGGSGEEISSGDNKGYLTQIKGPKNSKPLSKWHGAIVALLMDDEVGFLKKSSHKPELDFQITDLEPSIREKLLAAKPAIASFKKFVEGVAIKSLVGMAKDHATSTEQENAIKIVDKDTVELFRSDDIRDFWVKLVGEFVPKEVEKELKHIFDEWIDGHWDVDFYNRDVPVSDMLLHLEKEKPKLYAALSDRIDSFYQSEDFEDYEAFLRSDREEAEELFSAFADAYRQGLESGYSAEAYRSVIDTLDGCVFYNSDGDETVVCRKDPKKDYIWRAEISKMDLAASLVKYQEQGYYSSLLDFLFAANNESGNWSHKSTRDRQYFRIEPLNGEYDEDSACERLIETLHEAGVREDKKEKNPKLSKETIKGLQDDYEAGLDVKDIAEKYSVSTSTVYALNPAFRSKRRDFEKKHKAKGYKAYLAKENNLKFKKMPYKDLIKEHTNLVKILKSGDKKAITKETIEQEKELRQYILESKKTKNTDRPRFETFSFMAAQFDVTKGLKLAANQKPKMMKPSKTWFLPMISVDKEYAKTTDLSKPLLFATLVMGGRTGAMLIDGYHRLTKALAENVDKIPTVQLSFEDTIKILSSAGAFKRNMLKEARKLGVIK